MGEINAWEVMLRLLLSAVLAGFIGLERESHHRPAGLRTHILVSLGSCLIMLISIYGWGAASNRDPFRLAAQVVSGIGFLGAGTILHEGLTIRGLTTAASLWVVAGIGLAMGCGFYFPGIIGVVLVVLTLISFEKIEQKCFNNKGLHLTLVLDLKINPDWSSISANFGNNLHHMETEIDYAKQLANVILEINAKNLDKEQLLAQLAKINGVKKLKWK